MLMHAIEYSYMYNSINLFFVPIPNALYKFILFLEKMEKQANKKVVSETTIYGFTCLLGHFL